MNNKIYQIILKSGIVLLLVLLSFQSCKKDDFVDNNPALKLAFSSDSILFDTIFTTVGSATLKLKVYNHHDNTINISSIRLEGGSNSFYRINVDGYPSINVSDIEIAAKDSLFIFIHLTIDPNNTNNTLVVTDKIVFETNGNVQDVDLVAWGQDAYFYYYNTRKYYQVTNQKELEASVLLNMANIQETERDFIGCEINAINHFLDSESTGMDHNIDFKVLVCQISCCL